MRRIDLLLVAVAIFGLGLRLAGIGWGLPHAERYHSYHPDEALQVGASVRVDPLAGDFDPGFYNYGSLTFFLTRLAWELSEGIQPSGQQPWALSARVHLVGRLWTVCFGTLTLLLTFEIGKRLLQGDRPNAGLRTLSEAGTTAGPLPPAPGILRRTAHRILFGPGHHAQPSSTPAAFWRSDFSARLAGTCAAGLLAIAPAHVAHSHYFTVDVPAAFWTAATVVAALRVLDSPRLPLAALAGACAGFAAATKYNAGLVLLSPLSAILLSYRARLSALPGGEPPISRTRTCILPALTAIATAVLAFLAGCPGALLNSTAFLRDFLYEAHHAQSGHGLVFVQTPPAWLYHWITSLRFGLGLPLLAIVIMALVQAARRRSAADLVLAAWAVPYYLLIGFAQVKFMRYTLPLMPVLMAWAGVLCAESFLNITRSAARALSTSVLAGALLWTAGHTFSYTLLFVLPDPRDRAAAAIRSTLPPGSSIGLTTVPWFYSPPLVPWNGGPQTAADFEAARNSWTYRFLPGGWTAERVATERPDCFITSNLEEQIRDGLRLRLPEIERLVAALERDYHKQVFAPIVSWPGMLGPGYPPEDWMYPAPTVTVYLREESLGSSENPPAR